MEGLIIKVVSNDYTVLAKNKTYICKPRGKFRNNNLTPLVGDYVIFDEVNCYLKEILPRKNSLIRPLISNIDLCFIITSTRYPDFDSHLLDKLLVLIEFNNIKPIIVFTKLDLLKDEELNEIEKVMNYYKKIGYEVYKNTEVDLIKKCFKGKISVFTGQSGAGKSTLLNKLNVNLNLETNDISYKLGRGKHTTRHVELMSIYDGLVADTPGFSKLSLNEMTISDIRDNFSEFNVYKDKCKYRDCMHLKEDDCFIKNNPNILKSRYDNYVNFVNERK